MSFDKLGLSPQLLKAVSEAGYETPTPIQEKAIPATLSGRDVLGIAQTGTGKTAGFVLPMLEMLSKGRARARMPRSLIIEPTRELAAQVAENFEKYGKYNKLNMALLIGGVSFGDQDAKLMRGVDVLIATPGRLLDHFERGKLLLTGVQLLVIDEADRMLDMGFIPDIERIFKMTPFTRQTLFFSATMPSEIQKLTDNFLANPERIEVARPATTAENVEQRKIHITRGDDGAKRHALRELIKRNDIKNGIIFCNRKKTVDVVAKSLQKHGFDASPIHGDLPQSFRTQTLEKFRKGELQLLIASDVAARGLDIPDVGHVFNFDTPMHPDDYVHRIGRTGRAGRDGQAFLFWTDFEKKYLDTIEQLIGGPIPEYEGDDLLDGAPEARDRGPRRSDRERGGRGDRDRRPRSGGRKRSADKPREAADKPRETADKPRDDEAKEATRRNSDEPPRKRDGGRRKDESGRPVVGLGDHVPAFLRQTIEN